MLSMIAIVFSVCVVLLCAGVIVYSVVSEYTKTGAVPSSAKVNKQEHRGTVKHMTIKESSK